MSLPRDPGRGEGPPRETFKELLGQLASDSASLVREEIALAREEMRRSFTALTLRLVMILAGALIGVIALAVLSAAAVIGLGHVVGPGTSAVIIGVALAIIALGIALIGIQRLKRTTLKPEQTIETLREDKEWMKRLT